ncbi:Zinc finger protein 862-like 9 [Homarus americanus]|uniref:Zinc finger protein 862-like 9 n=1 Tax=Homarus americanus TaxID=6706 RepID=A0A8J5TBD4_HOMAM|nr:Zinc finger protein 862-like 9 [Homarus americanus]
MNSCDGETWKQKLVGIGTDGASIMTGCRNGLVARLRRDLEKPELEGIHGSAHKIELAYKDAVKDVPLAKKVDLLLLGIYLFYEKSSLNRSMLKRAHDICQVPFLVPTRVGGTRWLPHMLQALEHLLKSYKAIVLHMQQIQNPDDPTYHKDSSRKAQNFLLLLTSADIVQYLHLLLDVVLCLGGLSELFQHGQTNISAIVNEIQTAVDVLNKYLAWPGPSLRRIMEGDTTMFQGEKLSGRSNTFKTATRDMLTSLISSLNKRFIDIAKYSGNEDFGDSAVQALAQALEKTLMEAEVNPTLVEDEWTVLKSYIYKTSSADAERGFSQVKLIKTDWRSRLTDDHLTDHMVAQLHTESVGNLNPDKAIARFLTTGPAVWMATLTLLAAAQWKIWTTAMS